MAVAVAVSKVGQYSFSNHSSHEYGALNKLETCVINLNMDGISGRHRRRQLEAATIAEKTPGMKSGELSQGKLELTGVDIDWLKLNKRLQKKAPKAQIQTITLQSHRTMLG